MSHGPSVFDGFFFMTDEDGIGFYTRMCSPPDVHITSHRDNELRRPY
jgi:hypothetical protein